MNRLLGPQSCLAVLQNLLHASRLVHFLKQSECPCSTAGLCCSGSILQIIDPDVIFEAGGNHHFNNGTMAVLECDVDRCGADVAVDRGAGLNESFDNEAVTVRRSKQHQCFELPIVSLKSIESDTMSFQELPEHIGLAWI